jgi:signal transduction histidine kinase
MATVVLLTLAVLVVALGAALILQYRDKRNSRPSLILDSLIPSDESLAVAAASNLGIWNCDKDTGELWLSERCRELLGFAPSARVTQDLLYAVVRPSPDVGNQRAAQDEVSDPDLAESQLRITAPDGTARWVIARERVCRGGDGRFHRAVGIVFDDTERRKLATELLKQRQQLSHLTRVAILGELSGALAHELTQPLTSILSNAQAAQHLLARGQAQGEDLREILQDIVSDDKRAGELIRRLRALLTRGETNLQRVILPELVDEALTIARSDLVARKIDVQLHLARSLPAIHGDRVELQQVLLNLVLNACESMTGNADRQRRLEIAADRRDDDFVCISVLDSGRGLEPQHLERIFEPFFTTKANGLGIGLSICRSIISAHRGSLWATRNDDCGAAFHFTVPIFQG